MSEPSPGLKSHTYRQIQRWPTPQSKSWTLNFLDSAEQDENIVAVVAVGSTVRPAVASLDLDLVVICRDPAKLKAKPPIEIDLRVYAAEQVDALIGGGNDLLGWAVKFGLLLFQRARFWDNLLESWHDRVPLPSADVASRRADDTFRRLSNIFELGDYDAAWEQALSYITHLCRAELIKRQVYPASRPELPRQLRAAGCPRLALWLERFLDSTAANSEEIAHLLKSRRLKIGCTRRQPHGTPK
jgi:hypothetical protein